MRIGFSMCGAAFVVVTGMAAVADAQIADQRRIDRSQAGVPGGIPTRTTVCATFSPGASAAQINSAIASCPSGQVVQLNAGNYSIGALSFNNKSGVTLRGAGPDQTFLTFTGSVSCGGLAANICVKSGDSNYSGGPSNTATWTAGYAKGTTQVTLSNTANLAVGNLLILDQAERLEHRYRQHLGVLRHQCVLGRRARGRGRPGPPRREQIQLARVTGINGNTVTIAPGLYLPNWRASQNPGAWWSGSTVKNVGLEGMSLDHRTSGETSGIVFMNAYGSWVKGIRSITPNRNHIWFSLSAANTVRDSYFYGSQNFASVSYGIEQFQTSDNLIENNILHHITAPLMTQHASGAVVSYNYVFNDEYTVSPSWMQPSNYHHGTGVSYILHEGNDAVGLMVDIVHGPAAFVTAFRNYFTGFETGKDSQTIPVHIYAFSRYSNLVGNVLGTEGYHTTYESLPPSGTNANRAIFVMGWSGNGGQRNPNNMPNDPSVPARYLALGQLRRGHRHSPFPSQRSAECDRVVSEPRPIRHDPTGIALPVGSTLLVGDDALAGDRPGRHRRYRPGRPQPQDPCASVLGELDEGVRDYELQPDHMLRRRRAASASAASPNGAFGADRPSDRQPVGAWVPNASRIA